MSVPLAIQSASPFPPAVDGRPLVETGIAVGTLDDTGAFEPLANGDVSFPPYYQSLQSMEKNCTLWTNSGVFTIKLAAGEADLLASRPLAVVVSGNAVTQEAGSGTWVQIGEMVGRMPLPDANIAIPVVITQRGTPAANQTPPPPVIQMIEWSKDDNGNWNGNATDSTDLTAAFDPPQTDSNGATTLQIAGAVPDLKLSQVRAALDSRMYYIGLNASDSVSVADDYVPVSVLVWRPFAAPPEPAWEQDIEPILGAYARLYPGMKDRVDIGTESVVRGNALSIMQRMSLPISDPGYMPVTRDLAPAKVQMIVKFMQSWLAQQSTAT